MKFKNISEKTRFSYRHGLFVQHFFKYISLTGIILCFFIALVSGQTYLTVSHDASSNGICASRSCGQNESTVTLKIIGEDDLVPSHVVLIFDLVPAMVDTGVDDKYVCAGTIRNYVWLDQNFDGLQNDSEPGIQDVRVVLRDGTGVQVDETTTDLFGCYLFERLCPDDYEVDVDESTLPSDLMRPTKPNVGPDDSIDSDGPLDGGPVSVTLTDEKRHDPTIDFGYLECNGTIGDYVWLDQNFDGIQDDSELGIPEVRVVLRDGTGIGVNETTTDWFGYYLFENLCPGDYEVDVDESTLPSDLMRSTKPDVGPDDSIDSDGPLDGGPVSVTLTDEKRHYRTVDFGYVGYILSGMIGDTVYIDSNCNGIQNVDEPGLPGVRVILRDCTDILIYETITDLFGYYLFEDLPLGDYVVDVDESTLPPKMMGSSTANVGFDDTIDSDGPPDGNPVPVTLTEDDTCNLTIDFGYVLNGTIGDYVWFDKDEDGIQDLEEPGFPEIDVILYDVEGNELQRVKTDSNGSYEFTELCAGDYKVISEWPFDYVPTVSNAGDDNTIDSDYSLDDVPVPVILSLNYPRDMTIDFGFHRPPRKVSSNY